MHLRLLLPLKIGTPLPEGCGAAWIPSLEGISSYDLANTWDVVLVPLQRFSSEHAKPSGPLMRVHWLRLVLDEGHSLGASLGITSKLQVACAVAAERRWCVRGKPHSTAAVLLGS